jgi:glycine C-acetyltransferase
LAFLGDEVAALKAQGLFRHLRVLEREQGARTVVDGRDVVNLSSNNYLGLTTHPRLRKAALAALDEFGVGTGSVRTIAGTMTLHVELEQRLAAFKNTEATVVFQSGFAANAGTVAAILTKDDVVISDELNHASIIDGCRLSRAAVQVYRHKDRGHLEELLQKNGAARRRLIITDSVFSMDGDIAPLPDLVTLAENYGALLMVDDAHATGVLGKKGRGIAEYFGLEGRIHIQMGTFGKALGSFGAFAAGDRDIIDYLINRSRSYIFSTALPPAVCAASMAAIQIVEREPSRRDALWKNRQRFVAGLSAIGISVGNSETPIIPLVIGGAEKTLQAGSRLFAEGIFAAAIRPPTVADGASRIRTTMTATHSDQDIDTALAVLRKLKYEGVV